jgi:hypothetical protein
MLVAQLGVITEVLERAAATLSKPPARRNLSLCGGVMAAHDDAEGLAALARAIGRRSLRAYMGDADERALPG